MPLNHLPDIELWSMYFPVEVLGYGESFFLSVIPSISITFCPPSRVLFLSRYPRFLDWNVVLYRRWSQFVLKRPLLVYRRFFMLVYGWCTKLIQFPNFNSLHKNLMCFHTYSSLLSLMSVWCTPYKDKMLVLKNLITWNSVMKATAFAFIHLKN